MSKIKVTFIVTTVKDSQNHTIQQNSEWFNTIHAFISSPLTVSMKRREDSYGPTNKTESLKLSHGNNDTTHWTIYTGIFMQQWHLMEILGPPQVLQSPSTHILFVLFKYLGKVRMVFCVLISKQKKDTSHIPNSHSEV